MRRAAWTQFSSVADVATCATSRALSGETRCRAASLNGGFISTASTLSGARPRLRKRVGGGFNIEHDHAGCDFIGGCVAARELCELLVDLDQNEIDAGDTPRHRKPGGTDTGAEIHHAIAAARRRRGSQQHGVVAGAVT